MWFFMEKLTSLKQENRDGMTSVFGKANSSFRNILVTVIKTRKISLQNTIFILQTRIYEAT